MTTKQEINRRYYEKTRKVKHSDRRCIVCSEWFTPQRETRLTCSVNCRKIASRKLPKLPQDAPISVVMFAGGGGVECGMVEAGFRPVLSIEHDPGNVALSKAIADSNRHNFRRYGHRVIEMTVQDWAGAGFPGSPPIVDWLHASPVCSNYSQSKRKRVETVGDLTAAAAIAAAIEQLRPRRLSIENVPDYRKGKAFKLIAETLTDLGYPWTIQVINAADYGVPQRRPRLFILSGLEFPPPVLLAPQPSWYTAIADIVGSLPDDDLLPVQRENLEKQLKETPNTPAVLLGREGDRRKQVIPAEQPCFTIVRMMTTDQRGNNRNTPANIWLQDGTIKKANLQCLARWQGFPGWYQFPEKIAHGGGIVGYSVPPPLISSLKLV